MFAVLYSDKSEKWIRIYDHLWEAHQAATNAVCGCGFTATVFDYDQEIHEFIEMYDVG